MGFINSYGSCFASPRPELDASPPGHLSTPLLSSRTLSALERVQATAPGLEQLRVPSWGTVTAGSWEPHPGSGAGRGRAQGSVPALVCPEGYRPVVEERPRPLWVVWGEWPRLQGTQSEGTSASQEGAVPTTRHLARAARVNPRGGARAGSRGPPPPATRCPAPSLGPWESR